ncbi:MAG: carboxypeptidase-like regulatory domain-containing protein, partial [Alphaproteobacteria bacterium]|nr:carboxypeptidase-like regulatory domain-containing protein [Alphaproteobacteria bacterium]
MKALKIFVVFGLIAIIAPWHATFAAQTPTRTITGVVTDDKEPLFSANVIAFKNSDLLTNSSGGPIGTTTDFDGKFKLEIPTDATRLRVSFVGYNDQYIDIADGTNTYTVKMLGSSYNLAEIEIVADRCDKEQSAALNAKSSKWDDKKNKCVATECLPGFTNVDVNNNLAKLDACIKDDIQKISSAPDNTLPKIDSTVTKPELPFHKVSVSVNYDSGTPARDIEICVKSTDESCHKTDRHGNLTLQNVMDDETVYVKSDTTKTCTPSTTSYKCTFVIPDPVKTGGCDKSDMKKISHATSGTYDESGNCCATGCDTGYVVENCTCKTTKSQEDAQQEIDELRSNATAMKEKEQSDANRMLGGASMGATGIGAMMAASAYSEQRADA